MIDNSSLHSRIVPTKVVNIAIGIQCRSDILQHAFMYTYLQVLLDGSKKVSGNRSARVQINLEESARNGIGRDGFSTD